MKTNKKIWDYFDDTIEYPKNVIDNPIPYGEAWTYISSTFLNGMINYANPISCYVVNRYRKEDDMVQASVCDRGKFGNWYNFKGTKKELINAIISGDKEVYHTKLSCFEDDIIIVAKIEDDYSDDNNKYIFFWFDMDVSDCSIGKFKTTDSEQMIICSVENWLTEEFTKNKEHEERHEADSPGYYKLPLSFLKGWISF